MSTILSLRSNVPSLMAQRRLGDSLARTADSQSKLASGLRIRSAADDAAGLAISAGLGVDKRVFSQAVANANDGISLLHIADAAIENLAGIVTRISELATQAASGSLSAKQRLSIDAEAQALSAEYTRIAKTTQFNGLRLFDGSVQELRLQTGYGTEGSIASGLGGAMGTGSFTVSGSFSGAQYLSVDTADINGDGNIDIITPETGFVTIQLGNGDGSFGARTTGLSTETMITRIAAADVTGDGVLDLIGGADEIFVSSGRGDGTFSPAEFMGDTFASISDINTTDIDGNGAVDLAVSLADGYLAIYMGRGGGTFAPMRSYAMQDASVASCAFADFDRDGIADAVTSGGSTDFIGRISLRLGSGDGTFGAETSWFAGGNDTTTIAAADVNGDGRFDVVTTTDTYTAVMLGNGDGSFMGPATYDNGLVGTIGMRLQDMNGDAVADVLAAGVGGGGLLSVQLGNSDGSFRSSMTIAGGGTIARNLSVDDMNNDGVPDVVMVGRVGPPVGWGQILLGSARQGVGTILPFSLETQAEAKEALPMLHRKLESLSLQRGVIGAFESRARSALSSLSTTVRESAAAQSRLQDVDIAEESATMVREQILSETGASLLSHVNQFPALALRLLG